jgi:uncharacterized protein YcgL (UPF0745 family)
MALPANMMLAVLTSGANSADPGLMQPQKAGETRTEYLLRYNAWHAAWIAHGEKRKDPHFDLAYLQFQKTKNLLTKACFEPLDDVYRPQKKHSLMRRIERLHLETVSPYLAVKEPDPRKIGLITFYLIDLLVSTSYLIIPEDSSFGQALEVMLPGLSPCEQSSQLEVRDYKLLNASAQNQLRHVLNRLQAQGYYLGLEIPTTAIPDELVA